MENAAAPSCSVSGSQRRDRQTDADADSANQQAPAQPEHDMFGARAWADIVTELNNRCKTSLFLDQIKSKYTRLMIDYDLFKEVGGENSLSDEQWDELIEARPEHAARFRQFKELGCAHVDICRRIAASKEEAEATPGRKPKAERKPRTKRATRSDGVQPDPKKAAGGEAAAVPVLEGKNDREVFGEEGLKPQGWTDVTTELNKFSTANFNEKEVKEKYMDLMQRYNQFKIATGFSGDLSTTPRTRWTGSGLSANVRDITRHLKDSRTLVASRDTLPNGMGPTSTTTANLVTSTAPSAANGQSEGAIPGVSAPGTPAVFSQELHDNLNMFLKTATAYLVMLINDHNGQREL
ncbi:DnaJ subfamily A member 1 [Phytophthora nicotianae]|uniref:DnaJ subfamily A member 1 n=1 Tax=Phytophthora nicotianae TaxID=4792 RepID=A0A0W8DFJ7_PHYNI|nr:DnaJ subfamily A member 1 [Phytophthora nicotianae]